jgi:transposase
MYRQNLCTGVSPRRGPFADPTHRGGFRCRGVAFAAPLVAVHGVGYDTAGQLLVTAGDNPERLRHERSYAALCGSSPVQVSSGKTDRHRLNRGGDPHANSAL